MIVVFGGDGRWGGMDVGQGAIEGGEGRLRPILMTSFVFIFGIMPLAFATGAGAYGNRSIGTGAVGGMFIGTIFGVFAIPILFIIFQTLQEKIRRKPNPANSEDDNNALTH